MKKDAKGFLDVEVINQICPFSSDFYILYTHIHTKHYLKLDYVEDCFLFFVCACISVNKVAKVWLQFF